MEMKTGRFGIGHYPEVTQRAKTSGQTLNKLEQTGSMAPLVSRVFRKTTPSLIQCSGMRLEALTANLAVGVVRKRGRKSAGPV